MDPITAVNFLAAVVQLIDVTSKAVNYFNDVKDAPKDRAKLAREAANLLPLFTELRYRVEETNSTDPWFTGLKSLEGKGGPLMEFKSAMENIADKLAPATSVQSFKRVLRWTLDKKEVDAILSRIERLKTLVVLALQKDHFALSLATKEEISMGFQETKITQWLVAPLPSSNHNSAMKKRQPNTGEWFTQSKGYADWRIETGSFIWLHGIPGCGKTVLCSTIIQDVITNYQLEPTIAIAYFYFDFNDSSKQLTEKLIRSLVLQLSAQGSHSSSLLQLAFSRSQNGQKQLPIEDLKTLLHQMLKTFNGAYILLDALDECVDREDLLKLIEALMAWNIHGFHLLATSRKEHDISVSLEPLVTCPLCIQSALVDADIRVHIQERLSNDGKLKKWSIDVKKEIEDALMKGAKGMFRWVVCQLDSLRKCLKLDALRKALNTLPKTLDDTYDRILSNLDEDYEEYAFKVFNGSVFRPEQRLPDPCDILKICSTLVSVTAAATEDASKGTTGSQELRLAHFSVKEYLISDRLKKGSMHRYHITSLSANISIAQTCLTYLLHFKSPDILTAEFDHEFPLIKYAAELWPWHYRAIIDDGDRKVVDILGYNLVESENSCFINWLSISNPDQWNKSDLDLKTKRVPSPLYYMSLTGVSGVLEMILSKGANVNAKCGKHGNALSAASWDGHEKVVRLLLENGANVNAKGGFYGSALSVASDGGYEEVVQLLLENGANVNAQGSLYGNALSAASAGGYKEVVRLLLENGANVNAEGRRYGNPLSAASSGGYKEVVQLLLENGANVNAQGGRYGNALSAASSGGHKEVVRLLLDANAQSGRYDNALVAASNGGHEEVVRLLLEKGANINFGEETYASALYAASISGYEEVVRLLLENGAIVNADSEGFGNALVAAVDGGYKEVVRLLLENEANVNSEGGGYGNTLLEASLTGHEKVVRLLLENGANVNAEGGKYGNALSTASLQGHEEVVRLLLENGANVNAEGGRYGNALSAALFRSHEEVVRLLLEEGANVNAEGGRYGNALSTASLRGHEEVVRLLLENGANVNAEGGRYGNALSTASLRGHEEVVRLLLGNGANVNAEGGRDGNALSAASSRGHEKVVRLLLEEGANINAEGGRCGNALSAASWDDHKEVVRLLLENGANIDAGSEEYGNPLSGASWGGHEEVVRLLLEKGADVDAQRGRALRKASENGQKAVIRLLLKNKADINLIFLDDDKALHGIPLDDHEALIRLLLEKLKTTSTPSDIPWKKWSDNFYSD